MRAIVKLDMNSVYLSLAAVVAGSNCTTSPNPQTICLWPV